MADAPLPRLATAAPYTLSDFDFDLPRALIAQVPAHERTSSRLLHVDGERRTDLAFTDLLSLVRAGDLIVCNDTRVINARVHAQKPTGGKVELLIERVVATDEAWAQLSASHPAQPGATLVLPGSAQARVVTREGRFYLLRFFDTGPLGDWLERYGEVPLPPYIEGTPGDTDATRYQTVYAREPGAVAAPTAGLHFDAEMLAALHAQGVGRAFVTLHIGAGTFLPVATEDLTKHSMHSERYRIPPETAMAIDATRRRGGRVLAVGTTTLRALESAVDAAGALRTGERETTLFVTPGFRFRVADRLLTNFHLPKSTLLMLAAAFGGYDAVRAAYAHAISARYRFYSFGDAMLLERARTSEDVTPKRDRIIVG